VTRYEPAVDLDAVSAIDVHVHVESDGHGHLALDQELLDASAAYFKSSESRTPSVDDLAQRYRDAGLAAVVFTVDATTATGHPALSSEEIAETAMRHNDVLIPFGSVDPHQGPAAVDRARRLVEDHGVRGFKFHPSLQAFAPDDPAFTPLWATIEALGVPALFHTGQNGIGAGLPGGRGLKLRYSNPLLLDDVAADFPQLTVILAHPSVPWQDEAISIATHKSNVYIDLSGWSPKYFPPQLVRAANSLLKHKVLFGSDYPVITPDRWRRDFDALEIKDEVRPLILKDNAVRMLGLGRRGPDRSTG
jgi:predicted TIM-barrel fold metal-dependent hydrolase